MKKFTEDERQDFLETLDKAKNISKDLTSKLTEVSVTTRSPTVIEAVKQIFGVLPDSSGKVLITYAMYSQVIELMNTAGRYKSEEFK